MSWEPGRERVRELIDTGEVDRVTPDLTIAGRMLEDAGRHLATASAAKVAGDAAERTLGEASAGHHRLRPLSRGYFLAGRSAMYRQPAAGSAQPISARSLSARRAVEALVPCFSATRRAGGRSSPGPMMPSAICPM
jgi:hypothetical protein